MTDIEIIKALRDMLRSQTVNVKIEALLDGHDKVEEFQQMDGWLAACLAESEREARDSVVEKLSG